MLILAFSVYLPLFPISGRLSTHIYLETQTNMYTVDALLSGNFAALGNAIWHLILPALTLGTIPLAVIARMTRASMAEVMTAVQKADMSFRLMLQMRNKLVQAYNELRQIQI